MNSDFARALDIERSRAIAGRDAYIRRYMTDVPAVYTALMPADYNVRALRDAEDVVRRQIELDLKMLQSPWRPVGPESAMLDWDDMDGQERMTMHLECTPGLGMPAAIRRGFENHPDVLAAWEAAKTSPAKAAFDREYDARKAVERASAAYVAAANGNTPERPAVEAALKAYEQAASGEIEATPESVAQLESAYKTALDAYNASLPTPDEVERLEAEYNAALDAHEQAKKEANEAQQSAGR